jgi:hypothetical protein
MPQRVLKIQPSCVYEWSHARVEVFHCTQNAWNPVIGFLLATPANCQANLLCPLSLSICDLIPNKSDYGLLQERHQYVIVLIYKTQYTTGKVPSHQLGMVSFPLISLASVRLLHWSYLPLPITLPLPCIQLPRARESCLTYYVEFYLLVRISNRVRPMMIHNIVLKEQLHLRHRIEKHSLPEYYIFMVL